MTATPARIAGPVALPRRPRIAPPQGAVDAHAHILGPEARFPFAEGRGYTPPDAPVEAYLALLDRLGLSRGLMVQGNAHGFDNAVLLDALERAPDRLRAIAITDARIPAATLRDWHRLGVRGLRFHEHAPDARPGYVQGVGLEALAHFRPVMRDLGWVVQVFCHHRRLPAIAAELAEVAREMPVVIDHMLMVPAALGIADPGFQALLRLVGEGAAHVKLSAPYRLSVRFPGYADARPFHDALLAVNPERLLWGTDWPHTSIPAEAMPDDGALLDLFTDWTPRAEDRARILVETPARLFW